MLRGIISVDDISVDGINQIEATLKQIADRFRGGEQERLGKLGTKILKWVHRVRGIGDIIVQFDPVHAALPWAGFRLLLQVPPIVTI